MKAKWKKIKELFNRCSMVGSTAVVSFVDKTTGKVYTASLGDAEGRIFRQENVEIKLTGTRDWSVASERERAWKCREQLLRDQRYFGGKGDRIGGHLNVSRALGDYIYKSVSQKPVVTVSTLESGDQLILACDGLWDGLAVSSTLLKGSQENIANNLAEKAATLSNDNVTVIAMKFSVANHS
jgi:serine/threonine protein phosphatase PrpC